MTSACCTAARRGAPRMPGRRPDPQLAMFRFGLALFAAETEPGVVALLVPPAVRFAFVGATMPLTMTSYSEID